MQKAQAWGSIDLNRCLNPLFSNPRAKIGLSPARRLIRATLVSSRNAVYLLAATTAMAHLEAFLPVYAFILLALTATAGVYWQILSRDRRGQEVSPALFLALFALVFVLLAYLRSLADQAGFKARYDYVIGLDKALLGGEVPTVWLQKHLYSVGRISPLDIYCSVIYFSYFTVPFVAAVALWHLRPFGFRLYLSATLVAMCLSDAWFTLVPTAPPWLAGLDGHLPHLTRISAVVMETVRPGFYERGYQVVGINDVASFPSLHMAQVLLVVLASWRYDRRLRILGSVYAASMGFSLVYLAEHYASDILVGVLLAGFSWAVAVRLTPSIRQAQGKQVFVSGSCTVVSDSARRAA
jgi:membrane-associated phospholipid phosphatase